MIVLISEKDFTKYKKDIFKYRPGRHMLINGTNSNSINTIAECGEVLQGLRAKKSLRDASAKALMSKKRYEDSIREYLNSEDMMIAFKAATARIFRVDRSERKPDRDWIVFIILENKEYNNFADMIIERYRKLMKLDKDEISDIMVRFDDFKEFKRIYCKSLKKKLDKLKEKLRKVRDDDSRPRRDKAEDIDDLEDQIEEIENSLDEPSKKKARKYFMVNVKTPKYMIKVANRFMEKNKKNSFIEDGFGRGMR